MHKGNGLSVYLAPFALSCCTCITFADKLFRGVESHEKSRRAGMNEGHRGRKTVRQRNDRRHFPQREPWKAPQRADRRSGVSHDTACSAVPPFPGLITQLLLNLKCKGEGDLCSLIPPCFLPSPLSVCGWVCRTMGAQPQTVNADKINFLMLIPVGAECTEGKRSSPVQC